MKRKHLFENVITIGFYNLLFTQIFLTHACILSRHLLFILLIIFFFILTTAWCSKQNKYQNQVISTRDIRTNKMLTKGHLLRADQ